MKAEPFDIAYWSMRITEAKRVVAEEYPAGCLDWLRQTNPETIQELKATVEVLRQAFEKRNVKWLGKALVSYQSAHFTAYRRYEARAVDSNSF